MRLLPIDRKGYEIIVEALNNEIDQNFIFFNRIQSLFPITVEEVPRLMEIRQMVAVDIIDDTVPLGGIVAVGGFYNYEPFGNTFNGKLWFVLKQDLKDYHNIYKDVLKKLIDWGFRSCGLHKILVELRSDKSQLAKSLQILKFEKEGELTEQVLIRGKWRSVKIYGSTFKEEYETKEESESLSNEEIKKLSIEDLEKEWGLDKLNVKK